jgi:hypothetical protein
MADTWRGHFISRARILDWLKLLNFEVTLSSDFNLNSVKSTNGRLNANRHAFSAAAYAVKAIKRRYHLIPLTPVERTNPQLVFANSMSSPTESSQHD